MWIDCTSVKGMQGRCISSYLRETHQNTRPGCLQTTACAPCTHELRTHTQSDTHSHTCTLADNYPNSLWRAECPCGPHNHFRQGPWHTQDPPSLSVSQDVCLFYLIQRTWSVDPNRILSHVHLCGVGIKYATWSHETNLRSKIWHPYELCDFQTAGKMY